jgi:formylmethanofuran:tetrahydromethanopterin formyltransferase
MTHRALVEDTYAEAFRSIYAEVLITARDRRWLDHAVAAATGNASSSILCDCEAGLDRYVGPGGYESYLTPDGHWGRSCSSTSRASARTVRRRWSGRCWCGSARTC